MSEQRAPHVPAFELRHRLARALEDAGISNDDMAAELDCAVTTIRNYLRGRTVPTRATLIAWAFRCGVPFDWLAHGVHDGDHGPGGQEFTPRACNGGTVTALRSRRAKPAAPSEKAA